MSRGPGLSSPFQLGPLDPPKPRCHLPITAVVYPAFFISEGSVSTPGWMIAGPLGGAMPVFFWRNAYFPVRNENRVGVQVDAEQ